MNRESNQTSTPGKSETTFSFEVLPPLKGNGTGSLFRTIDRLREFAPAFVNITTHRSEHVYEEQADGTYLRRSLRRRPGTVAVASAIMQRYGLKVVPHLVCSGSTAEELEYMLLDLQFLGISEVLLLRGDKARDEKQFSPTPGGHAHTTELIAQVQRFNEGFFLDGTPISHPGPPFRYGVACYPEKHEEAPNLAFDIAMLLRKQELGAAYAISQLFYDNARWFHFVDNARAAGITIPLIPALKPLAKLSQFSVLPRTFHLDMPEPLAKEFALCKSDADVKALGIEWGVEQAKELKASGVPDIHFYTVSAVDSIAEIAKRVW